MAKRKDQWNKIHCLEAYRKAILTVREEVEKPGAEVWITNHDYFTLYARPLIVRKWAEITGFNPTLFPFSDNSMRQSWVNFRKQGKKGRSSVSDDMFS